MRGYRTWVWLGNMERCLEVGRETVLPICCSIPSQAPQRTDHSALPQTPSSGSVPAKHSDRQVHADPDVGLVFLLEPPSICPPPPSPAPTRSFSLKLQSCSWFQNNRIRPAHTAPDFRCPPEPGQYIFSCSNGRHASQ